ncbi:hypothetical protein HAX54_013146 [Datura stramonium]|uniref:Uncharacterized protein n=1 Tax=Datura stramonium TaxID=4076 RepID=A0ABS8TMR4_DATST|nr:hypothetical protein [Datura stramonium]
MTSTSKENKRGEKDEETNNKSKKIATGRERFMSPILFKENFFFNNNPFFARLLPFARWRSSAAVEVLENDATSLSSHRRENLTLNPASQSLLYLSRQHSASVVSRLSQFNNRQSQSPQGPDPIFPSPSFFSNPHH